MAGFEVNIPDGFLTQLLDADFDEICEDALNEAAPALEDSLRAAIVADGHVDTGDLAKAIKAEKAVKTSNGAWMAVATPKGYASQSSMARGKGKRRSKITNALKLIWLEYGIAGRQPATPVIQKAVISGEKKVLDILQNVYNRKAGAD